MLWSLKVLITSSCIFCYLYRMQRSSNTTARNIIIGSVIVVLLVSVLYYLKRVEVYHLKKNIDSLQVSVIEYN